MSLRRCETCGGVVREQVIDAALLFEQIKHYVRELETIGVPRAALDPIREWARDLRRCSCLDTSFEV